MYLILPLYINNYDIKHYTENIDNFNYIEDSTISDNIPSLHKGEIYGSWNNWTQPLTAQHICFRLFVKNNIYLIYNIPNNYFIEGIATNIISYKIKINDTYYLIDNYHTVNDNGNINNQIILIENNVYNNGLFQIKDINSKLEIYYNNKILLLCNMQNNCINGSFIRYYIDGGLLFEGTLLNNYIINTVIGYYKNGNKKYEGNWLNGYFHGNIIIYYSNGNKKYEAFMIKGYLHGKGIKYYKNSDVMYTATWIHGIPYNKNRFIINKIQKYVKNNILFIKNKFDL
jgi:antitoxin component YwqK of YwqJK toxin-antitoxin module